MFEVGKTLRHRYGEQLLPKNGYYDSKNLHVLSSPVPRCIMSALALLAGFSPPPADDQTFPFAWQPIPMAIDTDGIVSIYSLRLLEVELSQPISSIICDP